MSDQEHVSFWKQLTRLLLGLIVAVGFGLFWTAMIFGIGRFVWFFVGGIAAMALGIMHFFILARKSRKYRSR
ncbi:MAG: hypothetical protein IJ317_02005 [Clostridia bacterium]|nr:hypothetical protein [Clostridia bacterium]